MGPERRYEYCKRGKSLVNLNLKRSRTDVSSVQTCALSYYDSIPQLSIISHQYLCFGLSQKDHKQFSVRIPVVCPLSESPPALCCFDDEECRKNRCQKCRKETRVCSTVCKISTWRLSGPLWMRPPIPSCTAGAPNRSRASTSARAAIALRGTRPSSTPRPSSAPIARSCATPSSSSSSARIVINCRMSRSRKNGKKNCLASAPGTKTAISSR